MTARQMVCACEDVTLGDVHAAIRAGHNDMESLKRFTGLATGICQGRACMATAAACLRQQPSAPAALTPTTLRPPFVPIRLGALALDGELPPGFPGPQAPALYAAHVPSPPPAALPPLPPRAKVVIVGGGVMGLATAYHLAQLGLTDVVVLERSYLNAGASGRNGGGMRLQFSTRDNIALMCESMARTRGLTQELGINIWLRQGGYLFLARQPEQLAAAERHVALQNQLGVRSRLVTAARCRRLVPGLSTDDLAGGTFNPDDGVIFPWPFLWGYCNAARAKGVHVATFTPAVGFDIRAGRIHAVNTPRGSIACDLVINAAAAWANDIAGLAGTVLPSYPQRHEIMVTEALKPFLQPLVAEIGTGLYFSQSMRGEVVAGLGDRGEPKGLEMRSSWRFIVRIARALVARMPALAHLQVVRQWAGCYDITPDGNPLIGEVDGVGGLYALSGFMGHGFMMAPAVARRVAAHVAQGKACPILTAYRPQRFDDPAAQTAPETMIIG